MKSKVLSRRPKPTEISLKPFCTVANQLGMETLKNGSRRVRF
jgi:hypothetical protein